MTTDAITVTALRQEVRELTSTWQDQGRYAPRSDSWLRSYDLEFSREMARRKLLGLTWPVEYGGRGLSNVARLAVTEELLRAGAPVAAHWLSDRQIGPSILRHGSQRLREEVLPGIIAAQFIFCVGLSEPGAGSDLAALKTRARRVEGGWVINGRKVWTSHAHRATHLYVLTRTSEGERKHQGLSEFIVEMGQPGITVSPILDLAGEHHFNELILEDVFVPDHRLVGAEGNGWRQVTEQLAFERGGPERVLSSYAVLRHLVERESTDPEKLADLVARLAVLRRLCYDVARAIDRGEAPIQQAASLKYLGTTFELDVIEAAYDCGAGNVVPRDSVFGDGLLASPPFGIRGGASDVLLSIIAKQEARA